MTTGHVLLCLRANSVGIDQSGDSGDDEKEFRHIYDMNLQELLMNWISAEEEREKSRTTPSYLSMELKGQTSNLHEGRGRLGTQFSLN